MVDTSAVEEALSEVYDPEIPVNVVDLGLIYDIVERDDVENAVHVEMTLTSMGCPITDQIKRNVKNAALSVDGVEEASVELVWDDPWSPEKATEEGKAKLRSLGVSVPDSDGETPAANDVPF